MKNIIVIIVLLFITPLSISAQILGGNGGTADSPAYTVNTPPLGSIDTKGDSLLQLIKTRVFDSLVTWVSIKNFPDSTKQRLWVNLNNQYDSSRMSRSFVTVSNFPASSSNGLTDAQLRASAVTVDNSGVTQPISATALPLPTGAATSANQTTGNTSLSNIDTKIPSNLTVTSTRLLVDGSGVTQPISGTITANAGTGFQANALTDAQLRATAVPVSQSGTWNVGSITTLPSLPTGANTIGAISNTSFAATQATASNLNATVVGTGTFSVQNTAATPTGTNSIGTVGLNAGTNTIGNTNQTLATAEFAKITDGSNTVSVKAASTAAVATDLPIVTTTHPLSRETPKEANLLVTAVGVSAAAVTATIPAAGAGLFHCISKIKITQYNTAATVGNATPRTITTTNANSLAFTLPTAGAIGTAVYIDEDYNGSPMKSQLANTATTIVCPASASIIWRVTVNYFTCN